MDKETSSVLGLRKPRLSTKQKLPKRVSFKDETWVINIPAYEESQNAADLRDGFVFTRDSVVGNSWLNSGTDATRGRGRLQTFSTSSSFHGNKGQQSPQTTQTYGTINPGHDISRPPYKSILKSPATSYQRKSHLIETHLPAKQTRRVSASARYDFSDTCNNFKHDPSHLLPSREVINRLEKPFLARNLPASRSSFTRGQESREGVLYNKSARLYDQDFSFGRTSSDYDLNQSEKTRTINSGKQSQVNFDVVGVTYGRVDKMPYFHDISGAISGMKEYTPLLNSPNDRARFEHSTVSRTSHFDSNRGGRHISVIPAIAAFNRKTRDKAKHFSTTWTREYDTNLKRQLPMAWPPSKPYNFSTK